MPIDPRDETYVEPMRAGAGRVLLLSRSKDERVRKTPGGLVIPDCGNDTKGTRDNTWQGLVAACGVYLDRHAKPHDIPGMPLLVGSYVEHCRTNPFQTHDGYLVVNTDEIVRWAPPGDPPAWW